MTHAKLFIITLMVILMTADLASSQEMRAPKPLQNEFFDAMTGNSSGESEFNGKSYNESVSIQWDLNHQFIKISLTSVNKSNPEDRYEGLGIYGIDGTGKVRTWWFDSWGAGNVSTGSGSITGNKMQITESGDYYNSVNTFEFSDNAMTVTRKGSMKTGDGNEVPFNVTSRFKKNK